MNQPVQPIPKRFWWLKRLALGLVIFMLLLAGLRLWWGHRANARLDALITEIQATGEPIHFNDMLRPPVPDDQNKAYYLRQALAQWPVVPSQGVLVTETDWYYEPDNHTDPITDNDAYLQQVRNLLPLLEQADAAPRSDWGTVIQSPAISIAMPSLGESRRLARLMKDAAGRAASVGDVRFALQMVELTHSVSDSLEANVYFLLHHLVGLSIDNLCHATLEEHLPAIPTSQGLDASTRKLLESIKAQYINESDIRARSIKQSINERWGFYDNANIFIDGRLPLNQIGFSSSTLGFWNSATLLLIRPILVNDTSLGIEYRNIYIDVIKSSDNYPGFIAELTDQEVRRLGDRRLDYESDSLHYRFHPLTSTLMFSDESVMRAHYRLIALRRMAATAIAIKLYEADHGTHPATLNHLVPDYLPAVPLDPFTATGTPIRYLPNGCSLLAEEPSPEEEPDDDDGYGGYGGYGGYYGGLGGNGTGEYSRIKARGPAVLYSVGEDGVDNGGLMVVNGSGIIRPTNNQDVDEADLGFLLDTPEDTYPYDPIESESAQP